jgi:hypothetical protein
MVPQGLGEFNMHHALKITLSSDFLEIGKLKERRLTSKPIPLRFPLHSSSLMGNIPRVISLSTPIRMKTERGLLLLSIGTKRGSSFRIMRH